MTLTLRKTKPKQNHPFRMPKLPSSRYPKAKNKVKAPPLKTRIPSQDDISAPKPEWHEPVSGQEHRSGLTQLPALQLYLREIGQVKLLTPKEEIALARRIKKGDERFAKN